MIMEKTGFAVFDPNSGKTLRVVQKYGYYSRRLTLTDDLFKAEIFSDIQMARRYLELYTSMHVNQKNLEIRKITLSFDQNFRG